MSKTINGICVAALTAVQAAIINQARSAAPGLKDQGADERKQIKREVYAVVKAKFGLPEGVKLRANTKGTDQKQYLILHTGNGNRRGGVAPGLAFVLGADNKWTGSYAKHDDLFPPPAPVVEAAAASATHDTAGSVFGGTQSGGWFRLDASMVADALTNDDSGYTADDMGVGDTVPLPTPHLLLAGRNDLAIAADGAIYRKA